MRRRHYLTFRDNHSTEELRSKEKGMVRKLEQWKMLKSEKERLSEKER